MGERRGGIGRSDGRRNNSIIGMAVKEGHGDDGWWEGELWRESKTTFGRVGLVVYGISVGAGCLKS